MIEAVKTALLTVLVYLVAVPLRVLRRAGLIVFFLATAYLLGREYFQLAAMRFRPAAEAKAMRKRQRRHVFIAGLLIAAFVSIPIVNLATPLFGMAFMVHMHKRLSAAPRTDRAGTPAARFAGGIVGARNASQQQPSSPRTRGSDQSVSLLTAALCDTGSPGQARR